MSVLTVGYTPPAAYTIHPSQRAFNVKQSAQCMHLDAATYTVRTITVHARQASAAAQGRTSR